MSEQQPSEEELRAALEEQMRRIRVEDVIVQTAVTLVNLAGRRLGLGGGEEDEKDIGQARLAIDGARALMPLLPAETAGPVRDALSQLQMAYAREAPGTGAGTEQQQPAQKPPAAGATEQDDAERAKARSKIWTPPGA
jgi:hypothetical protein